MHSFSILPQGRGQGNALKCKNSIWMHCKHFIQRGQKVLSLLFCPLVAIRDIIHLNAMQNIWMEFTHYDCLGANDLTHVGIIFFGSHVQHFDEWVSCMVSYASNDYNYYLHTLQAGQIVVPIFKVVFFPLLNFLRFVTGVLAFITIIIFWCYYCISYSESSLQFFSLLVIILHAWAESACPWKIWVYTQYSFCCITGTVHQIL